MRESASGRKPRVSAKVDIKGLTSGPKTKPKPVAPKPKPERVRATTPMTPMERERYQASRPGPMPSKSKTKESPLQPTNRPRTAKVTKNVSARTAQYETKFGLIKQKDVKWVPAQKDKSGKVVKKGYLTYRSGAMQDKPVSGRVLVERPGTTYLAERRKTADARGGQVKRRNRDATYEVAVYKDGVNMMAPSSVASRKAAAAKRAKQRMASRGKKG